jgi:2-dehydropantoate 2-reductase
LGVNLPADYAEERLRFADTVPQDMTTSLYHDLEAGRPLEVEWLAGTVVTLGRRQGVQTPLCRAVWDILALHARGR